MIDPSKIQIGDLLKTKTNIFVFDPKQFNKKQIPSYKGKWVPRKIITVLDKKIDNNREDYCKFSFLIMADGVVYTIYLDPNVGNAAKLERL